MGDWLYLIIAIVVVAIGVVVGFVTVGRRRRQYADAHAPTREVTTAPETSPETGTETGTAVEAPEAPVALEKPEGTASRLVRLRQRLAGSQGGFGRGLLSLLSR